MTGENWIPEYADDLDVKLINGDFEGFTIWDKYSTEGFVHSGRFTNITGTVDYSDEMTDDITPSRHFTFIFHLFVMLQVSNFFCARKILDEKNIFTGLMSSLFFIIIVITIIALQALLVSVGGIVFNCYTYGHAGLRGEHWGMCVAIACITFFWNFFLKFIPEDKCIRFGNK